MDWPALLASLEQERAAHVQAIADINAVIPTVRKHASAQVPAGLTLPPPSNGSKGRGRRDLSLEATARKLYEAGTPVKQVAREIGRPIGTIYRWASAGKWKRPKPDELHSAPVSNGKGTQLSGSVKCTNPECGQWTDWDPCRACGKPLKRKW